MEPRSFAMQGQGSSWRIANGKQMQCAVSSAAERVSHPAGLSWSVKARWNDQKDRRGWTQEGGVGCSLLRSPLLGC